MSNPSVTYGTGTADDPWILKTPSQTSDYQAWKDESLDPPALVVQVGSTRLSYRLRALDDLAGMLEAHGDWMPLGNADEGKPVQPGTIEAWARDANNPVGGYYGLRKGYRGRFANYVTPVLELLGLVELEHGPRNNRARSRTSPAEPIAGKASAKAGSRTRA
ncbi:MAG: DUF6855 family protein [Vicinamibacterales bacterium]